LTSLGDDLSLEQKLVIFNLMAKKESIKNLAEGNGVTLFCTPQDVNLNLSAFGSIDNKHEDMLKVMPPVVPKKDLMKQSNIASTIGY